MSLTLRDIVARGTPLDWFESVAIVQELAAAVLAEAGPQPLVPDLAGVLVEADGSVSVTNGGSPDQAPVFRLAHVLNTLLSNATPPVQLRLIVLTALSPEPTYKSLHEFSQALEYFERPDRRLVVQQVYERAQKRPAPAVETDVPVIPEGPTSPPPPPKARKFQWRREHTFAAVFVPLALALMAAGWWWFSRPSGAKVFAETKQVVARAVTSAVEAVKSKFGSQPPPPVVEAPPTPAPPPRAARASRPRLLRPARSLAQNGVAPIVTLAPTVDTATWTRPPMEPVDEVVYLNLEPATPSDAASAAAADAVYSESDPGVRAPVLLRPMLPTDPPPGVPLAELTRLELLVSAAGEVESVKIVAGPRSSLDSMMLSAVKAWQFQAATKDGRPVAFRHHVWLTNR